MVVNDFTSDSMIGGQRLSKREIADLNRGHDYICFISYLERVPIFEDMTSALGCITKLAQTGKKLADIAGSLDVSLPILRNTPLKDKLKSAVEIFLHHRSPHRAGVPDSMPIPAAAKAIQKYMNVGIRDDEIHGIINECAVDGRRDARKTDVTMDDFCCVIAGLTLRSRLAEDIPDSLAPPVPDPAAAEIGADLFLGGNCGLESGAAAVYNWREEIAVPLLDEHGFTYYNPQTPNWKPAAIPRERTRIERCKVLLFVINEYTRAIASMVEAAHFIGKGHKPIVLCVKHFVGTCDPATGEALNTESEIKDLNRGRYYLEDCAGRQNVKICTKIEDAVAESVAILAALKAGKPTAVSPATPPVVPTGTPDKADAREDLAAHTNTNAAAAAAHAAHPTPQPAAAVAATATASTAPGASTPPKHDLVSQTSRDRGIRRHSVSRGRLRRSSSDGYVPAMHSAIDQLSPELSSAALECISTVAEPPPSPGLQPPPSPGVAQQLPRGSGARARLPSLALERTTSWSAGDARQASA